MPTFEWKPEYNLDIKSIDAQHKRFLNTINILHEGIRDGKSAKVMTVVFEGLLDYSNLHFATEEEYMAAYGYPDYEEHREAHRKFTAKVLEFKKEFCAGKQTLSIELINYLTDWFQDHELKMDGKYAPFLKEKGVD